MQPMDIDLTSLTASGTTTSSGVTGGSMTLSANSSTNGPNTFTFQVYGAGDVSTLSNDCNRPSFDETNPSGPTLVLSTVPGGPNVANSSHCGSVGREAAIRLPSNSATPFNSQTVVTPITSHLDLSYSAPGSVGPLVVPAKMANSSMSKKASGGDSVNQSSNRLLYTSERHAKHCMEAMNSLRKHKELCDVILLVDGIEIHAHRAVLSAFSPYFRAMFTGELAESRQTEVTLHGLDGAAVENLILFCYTSQITVEESNVQCLLPAACLLQLSEIQEVCCEFLKRQLDPSNCLGIRAFADTHACRDLLRVADRFTQLNFLEVVESEEFLLLPVNQLVDILSSDELNVRSEEQVFTAVQRWIHHSLSDRRRHLAYLLQHVRLPLLAPKFLVGTVGADLLVRSDERCRDLVDEAKNYLLLPQERPLMQGPRTRPRKPIPAGEVLFAVGGWCSGDAIASAEHYDPRTHEWHLVAPMHKRRCGVGVAVLHDLLYAVGGHDGQSYLNSVERYDPQTNQWSSDIAPTSTCRTSVGVAVLNGSMYAVGGQDGVSCLSLVERYDPGPNKWLKVTSMSTQRLGVGVGVLNGQLYAVGGSDGHQPLASVEQFDPRVGTWHRLPCMGTRRKHLGVAIYNGLIYAVGGRDETTELSSTECFDIRARCWTPVVAMTSRRSGVGLAVVNDQLIAIGGFDGATYLKTVEAYDPDSNCWRFRGNMNSRRLGGGVGVVRLANSPLRFATSSGLFESTEDVLTSVTGLPASVSSISSHRPNRKTTSTAISSSTPGHSNSLTLSASISNSTATAVGQSPVNGVANIMSHSTSGTSSTSANSTAVNNSFLF